MRIRTVIAEDQIDARKGLESLMNQKSDFQLVAVAKNGIEAIEQIQLYKPDLVLLDIQMPGADGFEVLNSLTMESLPSVIFITAYDQFAINAFDVNAIDYLLKPYTDERLENALNKMKKTFISRSLPSSQSDLQQLMKFYRCKKPLKNEYSSFQDKERFVIREHGRIQLVYFKNLIWVEAYDYYSKLHTVEGMFLIRKPLKEIEKELPSGFVRIHRSFIIRIDQIKAVKKETYGGTIILKNSHPLSVSSRYWKSVKEIL